MKSWLSCPATWTTSGPPTRPSRRTSGGGGGGGPVAVVVAAQECIPGVHSPSGREERTCPRITRRTMHSCPNPAARACTPPGMRDRRVPANETPWLCGTFFMSLIRDIKGVPHNRMKAALGGRWTSTDGPARADTSPERADWHMRPQRGRRQGQEETSCVTENKGLCGARRLASSGPLFSAAFFWLCATSLMSGSSGHKRYASQSARNWHFVSFPGVV